MNRPSPRSRNAYKVFMDVPTRWMDNDVYGHVNNVTYYSYFDTAVNSYLIDQHVLDIEHSQTIGLVVETGCRYFASVTFPDPLEVGIRVAQLGRSSVRYELGVFEKNAHNPSAEGHFIHVYVDREKRRPVALPDALRTVLQTLTTESN